MHYVTQALFLFTQFQVNCHAPVAHKNAFQSYLTKDTLERGLFKTARNPVEYNLKNLKKSEIQKCKIKIFERGNDLKLVFWIFKP